MSKLKNQIAQLKLDRLEEIKNDSSLSKLQKLQAFRDEDLMKVRGYLSHPFRKYEELLKEQEKARGETVIIIDDIIGMNSDCYGRGQEISYAEIAEQILENADYENQTTVTIAKARGEWDYSVSPPKRKTPASLEIPVEEAVDCLYNYAVENNESGFCFDW